MGFLDIVGLRYNLGITYVNIFNDGMFNSLMWVLPKFVLVYGFIMQVLYVMYIGTIGKHQFYMSHVCIAFWVFVQWRML
jgi:hypothetical protein